VETPESVCGTVLTVSEPNEVAPTDPATLYRQFVDLARSVGHGMADKNPQYGNDLVDEAVSYLGLLVCTADSQYDPRRSKMSTWIHNSIRWYLLGYLKKRYRRDEKEVLMERFPQETRDGR